MPDPDDHSDVGEQQSQSGADESVRNADESELSQAEALAAIKNDRTQRNDAIKSYEILAKRLRRLENAQLQVGTLNFFGAGVSVGGSLNTGVGKAIQHAERSTPLGDPGEWFPNQHSSTYVKPTNFAATLQKLMHHHLVVLSGRPGTGRESAARELLTEAIQLRGNEKNALGSRVVAAKDLPFIEKWSTDAPAGLLCRFDVPLTETAESSGEAYGDGWIAAAKQRLSAVGAFLVIVGALPSSTGKRTGEQSHVTVTDLGAVDSAEVLRRHLLDLDDSIEPSQIEGIIEDPQVRSFLLEWSEPRYLTYAAHIACESLDAGVSLSESLRGIRDPRPFVAQWFLENEHASEALAFTVSVAVLEDSSYLTVADAANRLLRDIELYPRARTSIRFQRDVLAQHTLVKAYSAEIDKSADAPRTMRFRNTLVQPAVLEYLWMQFDDVRPALLTWLSELISQRNTEVRARAATAAGMLALQDLEYALDRFLTHWASSKEYARRQAAAIALGFVASQPEFAEEIWHLVADWAETAGSGNQRLPSTAAIMLGGPLGTREPARTLALAQKLLRLGGWSLLETISVAVLQVASGGHGSEVLRALVSWTSMDGDESLALKSLVVFVVVASAAKTEPEPKWPDEGQHATNESALLIDALMEAGNSRYEFPELWGRALSSREVRPIALQALRDWLRAVDRGVANYNVILDTLAGVADRGERDFQRLEYHLHAWAEDRFEPSGAAKSALQALLDAS